MHMTEKEFKEFIENKPYLHQKTELKKGNKYHNKKIWIYDGVPSEVKLPDKKTKMVFDSKKEYIHWNELKLLEEKGLINNLLRQREIEIIPDFEYCGEKIKGIKYKADFIYMDAEGKTVVEDVKPFDRKTNKYITTKDFNLKWKLLKNKYPEYIFKLV